MIVYIQLDSNTMCLYIYIYLFMAWLCIMTSVFWYQLLNILMIGEFVMTLILGI
jgi:hypothetical protein